MKAQHAVACRSSEQGMGRAEIRAQRAQGAGKPMLIE